MEALRGYVDFLIARGAQPGLRALLAGQIPAAPTELELLDGLPAYTRDVQLAVAIAKDLRRCFGHGQQRQQAFMAALVDALPGSVSFIDAHETLLLINREGAERLGQTPDQLVGKSMHEILGPAYELVAEPIRRMKATGQAVRETGQRLDRPGREPVYRDYALVPLQGPTGELEGVLSVSFDVTERMLSGQRDQAYIAQLERLDTLKNDFLGMVSHELRTPINAVMGFASILEEQIPGPLNAEQQAFISRIMAGADVLLSLIEDLLDMTRIQAGKFTVSCQPVDAGAIAREVTASLQPLAAQRHQRLELDLAGEAGPLRADPQRLAQVLTNLLGNAVKFAPPGDHLRLTVAWEPEAVRFEVEDHGPGIQPDELGKLFEPFTRLDLGDTRRSSGAGLGLSIVKAIAESHGGSVAVASQPGVRTAFTVRLPRSGPR